MTQKDFSSLFHRAPDQLLCLQVSMQTARKQEPKKNQPKMQPFFQVVMVKEVLTKADGDTP